MIYNYRYNYSALYIDVSYKYVSRETIKIIYIRIYICVYTYTYNNILDRYENSGSRTIFSFLLYRRKLLYYICRLSCLYRRKHSYIYVGFYVCAFSSIYRRKRKDILLSTPSLFSNLILI